jgi:hypothetical protein
MEAKKARKIIRKILEEDPKEIGVFISLLTYNYMLKYQIDEDFVFRALKNSLKIFSSEDKIKKIKKAGEKNERTTKNNE